MGHSCWPKGGSLCLASDTATICGLLVDAVRPDSYSSEESNFWSDLEDWFEIGLTGLAMEYFF